MTCRFDPASTPADGPISIRNRATKASKDVSKGDIAGKKKTQPTVLRSMKLEVLEGKVILDLPIRTKSEANCFEPWRLKYARHKEQQRLVALGLGTVRGAIRLPCSVLLTRYAPTELDVFDNLPASFKYIVDAVCAIITGDYRAGRADGDKRISIACNQVKSKEYGIRIEVTNVEASS